MTLRLLDMAYWILLVSAVALLAWAGEKIARPALLIAVGLLVRLGVID